MMLSFLWGKKKRVLVRIDVNIMGTSNRNIMQDLGKNLARIWQESGKIFDISCKILARIFQDLARFLNVCPGKSCMILTDLENHF